MVGMWVTIILAGAEVLRREAVKGEIGREEGMVEAKGKIKGGMEAGWVRNETLDGSQKAPISASSSPQYSTLTIQ